MGNSQVLKNVEAVALGILADIQVQYPDHDFSRDRKRMCDQSSNRGLGFYTLDLPSMDEYLLASIQKGSLISRPMFNYKRREVKVPKFLSGLWENIFDNNGVLKGNACPSAISLLRQFLTFAKKIEIDTTPQRKKKALKGYIDDEQFHIQQPTLGWNSGYDTFCSDLNHCRVSFADLVDDFAHIDLPESDRLCEANRRALLLHLQHVADEVVGKFNKSSTESLMDSDEPVWNSLRPKHGPGAVSNPEACDGRKSVISYWPKRLYERFSPSLARIPFLQVAVSKAIDVPSKVCCVPKTQKGPRIIAAESIQNQYVQQLILARLKVEIDSTGLRDLLDLADQSSSQRIVQEGSKTGEVLTMDLSSASDLLSCYTVERMFRRNPELLLDLFSSRSQATRINNKEADIDELISLKKFASQGSACTFPIESICFLIIVLAAVTFGDRSFATSFDIELYKKRYGSRTQVYGDDMISPTYAGYQLRKLLLLNGLRINETKSFSGRFLESCGMDAFDGHDVTPLKPKRFEVTGPEGLTTVVAAANNFLRKGLFNASKALKLLVPQGIGDIMPLISFNESGVYPGYLYWNTYSRLEDQVLVPSRMKIRWSESLQRVEYLLPFVIQKEKQTKSTCKGPTQLDYNVCEKLSLNTFRRTGEGPRNLDHLAAKPGSSEKHIAFRAVPKVRRSYGVLY